MPQDTSLVSRSQPSRKRIDYGVLACLLWLLLSLKATPDVLAYESHSSSPAVPSQSINVDNQIRQLEPGKPIERALGGGETHLYKLELASGQYLHVAVDQRGIDVAVVVVGPSGKQILEVDDANGNQGREPVVLVTEEAGSYRFEVRSLNKAASAGAYEVRIEEYRNARPEDMSRIEGERALADAQRLYRTATVAAKRKAIEKYEEALQLMRAANSRQREAFILLNLGVAYHSLGDLRKALDHYNQSLATSKAANYAEGEAASLNDIGLAYNALGEPKKALGYYNQALAITKATGDRHGEARSLNTIGLAYNYLGEKEKALDHFIQALSIRKALGDAAGESVVLNNLGLVYQSIGKTQKALDYYAQALSIMKTVGDPAARAATLNGVGRIYSMLGDTDRALDYYNQALLLVKTIGFRQGESRVINNIGLVYMALGESQKALDHFNQALVMAKAIGFREGEAQPLKNIALIYDSLGEKRNALDNFNQALSIMRDIGNREGETITLYHIGQVYASLQEDQKALDYLNQAHLGAKAIADRTGESATLFRIAMSERALGKLSEAHVHIEAALDIIESLRVEVAGSEYRSSYFASFEECYEFYIDLLMQLHKINPTQRHDQAAFQAAERARARTLLEILVEARGDIRKGVDPSLLERERSLQFLLDGKIERRLRLLGGKHTPEQAAEINREVEALISEYQELQSQIRAKSPQYAALTQPQPLSLPEIQRQVLDRNTLLLEFSLGKQRSYLWLVSDGALMTFELPPRTEIETAARRVYRLLTARSEPYKTTSEKREAVARADREYEAAAAALSRMLLGSAADQLSGKRLLVVTDGALQYIPFGALPVPKAASQKVGQSRAPSSSSVRPLIADHEVVSLPSASALAVLRQEISGRNPAPKLVAVIADPVFDRSDPRLIPTRQGGEDNRSSIENGANRLSPASEPAPASTFSAELRRSAVDTGLGDERHSLPRLPFTRLEARHILAASPKGGAKSMLDFQASKAAATSSELGAYRIVHFATHGLLNNRHPELSGLVLSLVDEKGDTQDGFLRLQDIYNLNLSANLVVLSACRTALGKDIKGEGIVGLTRGFMYAGAARVMASLWKIDDDATAELMGLFYDRMLKEGMTPASALRSAELTMWKSGTWKSPFYWAGFALYGEWK